ncbi:efflux RND transporter periplasmic adaptor subunit [Chitinophaga sp. Cy-1792]|uniref:efflux RND transporter periplasmic adaptor subunit n=1 Tax=Chitinophaga sp. Cy-1792 TaxID=2608339 RepID=UPI001420C0F5|nr:efflux RND transporter periplasmic adaptor subunit [Chitinophaga sp. Cy-1792]NIG54139.1 efflux RND transporter periplasmic adaptor subunit [Chitinophaga sp. Cy-1792]
MKLRHISLLCLTVISLLMACKSHQQEKKNTGTSGKLTVSDSGRVIVFPNDTLTLHFFKTETAGRSDLSGELTAPARVVATVVKSNPNVPQNIVLFDNPELTANYTEMLQHIINIRQKNGIILQKQAIARQKQIEVDRAQDLLNHGAGTGKDVSDAKTDLITAQTDVAVAQTELANEKTSIIEHESRLKLAGFDPDALINATPGKIWIICDIPENQVTKVKEGSSCQLRFTSFPATPYTGKVEDVGEVVDNVTRMVKLRIGLFDSRQQLKAGMYATVRFGVNEGESISVPRSAVVTVQGNNYVFIRQNENTFIRQEVQTGAQVNGRMVVYSGLQPGEQVVTDGTMQLKGISFGY